MKISSTETRIVVRRLRVEGRLDAAAAPDLRASIAQEIEEGAVELIVDLDAVDYIDSAALAALVNGMKQARERGGNLQLVRPRSAHAFRVFELTRFDRVFRFVEGS